MLLQLIENRRSGTGLIACYDSLNIPLYQKTIKYKNYGLPIVKKNVKL